MTRRTCLPLLEWPRRDREAWARAIRPGDPFTQGSPAAGWAPATRGHVLEGVGSFACWAGAQASFEPDDSIADRCTPEVVAAYAETTLARVRGTTMRTRLVGLRRGLAVMYPDRDWRFLAAMLKEIPARADLQGKRRRLRTGKELSDLGCSMMADAEADASRRTIDRAIRYRNGLAIALLAARPLRRRNFAGLMIGHHLLRIRDGWWLSLAGPETKTEHPIEMAWPDALVDPLERYLARWRPILAARGPDPSDAHAGFLWLSTRGRRLSPHTLACEISAITKGAFGVGVNMHLFRDALATDIAITDPEHVAIAAILLGHRQQATTERHYNLARSVEAAADYHRALKRLR